MTDDRTPTARDRLPVALLLDTSTSMADVLDDVLRGAAAALDVAWGSTLLPVRPQVGIVTTGGTARVTVPLGDPFDPADLDGLTADGPADLDGAIQLLADEVERCTTENLAAGRRTLRPWVLLVSDGRWGSRDVATALDRLHAPPTSPVVHPVGVGAVDETTLARVATDGGIAVDTPGDLDAVLGDLVRELLVLADPSAGHVTAPAGSRPLEGW